MQAAGQEDALLAGHVASDGPVVSCATAAPACRGRVEQETPGDILIRLKLDGIKRAAHVQGFEHRTLDALAEFGWLVAMQLNDI